MNIPDEAIEAAARVAYSEVRCDMAGYGFDAPKSFDKLFPGTKAYFREKVRPFIVAALPHITGREVEDATVRDFWRVTRPGSYCIDGPVRDEDRAGYYAALGFFTH